jgi:phosphoglycerate dehydrogenase-like enzyme
MDQVYNSADTESREKTMKIVITGRNFTTYDTRAVRMLTDAGYEVVDYSAADMGSGTDEETVYEAVKDADIAITGLEPYRKALIDRCPGLRMISRRGIGYDTVDIEACKARGITVARTVGMVEGSVAEYVMAAILYFSRRLDLQSRPMHEGRWERILMPGQRAGRSDWSGSAGSEKRLPGARRPSV